MPEECEADTSAVKLLTTLLKQFDTYSERYNEKMTIRKITEEYGMGYEKVWKMFKDPELPVQSYTKPAFVLRGELEKYFRVRHDYLKNT